MRSRTAAVATGLGIALLAGCAGGQDPAAEAGAASTRPDTAAEAGTVDVDDFAYRPGTVTVAAGSEVTWTNVDTVLHSVTAGSPDQAQPDAFDLEVDEAGQTVSHTFEEPGTYAYFCRYHHFMLGTVEVTG